jgi:hypothetical protein
MLLVAPCLLVGALLRVIVSAVSLPAARSATETPHRLPYTPRAGLPHTGGGQKQHFLTTCSDAQQQNRPDHHPDRHPAFHGPLSVIHPPSHVHEELSMLYCNDQWK